MSYLENIEINIASLANHVDNIHIHTNANIATNELTLTSVATTVTMCYLLLFLLNIGEVNSLNFRNPFRLFGKGK